MATMIVLGVLAVVSCVAAVLFAVRDSAGRRGLAGLTQARDEAVAKVAGAERRAENAERKAGQLAEQVPALTTERDALKDEVRRTTEELRRVTREVRKLKDDQDDAQSHRQHESVELDKLREESAVLRTENRKLKDQVTSVEANARKAAAEPKVVEKVVERVRSDEGAAQREGQLKGDLDRAKARIDDLYRRAAKSEAEFRRMRAAYGELIKTYRLVKRSNELLEHELDYRQLGERAPTLNFEGDPVEESKPAQPAGAGLAPAQPAVPEPGPVAVTETVTETESVSEA
jgi:chromosome segregation ATPase